MGAGPNDLGTSRRHLRAALDDSLRRLGVEHIDLYQLHAWDALTPLDETLRFLDDAISQGKIGYYGFSNFTGWQLTKATMLAERHGWNLPVTLQPQYSLLVRGIEHEIVPAALDAGLGTAALVAAGRRLAERQVPPRRAADRQHAARREPGARHGGMGAPQREPSHLADHRRGDRDRRGARRVAVAGRARVAVAQPAVTSVILGARSIEQLRDNMGAVHARPGCRGARAADRGERPAGRGLPVR